MTVGLLVDCDEQVAQHFSASYGVPLFKYDRALGLIRDGKLVGTVLFSNWNGYHVELSYYGKKTMTAGVIRALAQYGIKHFNPSRATVITSKRNKRFIRALMRIGFKLEGVQRRYYGADDTNRNAGVRFVMFRDRIEEIAGVTPSEGTTQCS